VSIRVVVVDDHAVVREGLKRILSEDPRVKVVGEAGDDVEALTMVERQRPDAVITDISMPGRGGLELLHELGRQHPRLPVLVLSIHSEDELAVRALKAGAAGYLTKDSAPEELLQAVLRVAVGGRYLSPGVAERLAFHLDARVSEALHQRLSDREYQVLTKLAQGRSVGQIAEELALSPKTISTYRVRLLEKLGLGSNAELISYALRNGLVP
jgi:two-component system, NarL family, invasion response regulator UvrY